MITFTQLIDAAIKQDNEKEHISSGKWKPSMFGSCYRRQYWHRAGEKETNPPDARALRIFKCGDLFHDFIQNLLGDSVQSEVLVETKDVKGYADCVGEDIVIDIKSVHSKSFWWMTKSADIKKDKYNNFLQVMWYAMALGKNYAELAFVSKDDLCIQEYRMEVDEYWRHEVAIELKTLNHYWDTEQLPAATPRLYVSEKTPCKECTYCSFMNKCYEQEGKPVPQTKEE